MLCTQYLRSYLTYEIDIWYAVPWLYVEMLINFWADCIIYYQSYAPFCDSWTYSTRFPIFWIWTCLGPWNFICFFYLKNKQIHIFVHTFDWSINNEIIPLYNLYIGPAMIKCCGCIIVRTIQHMKLIFGIQYPDHMEIYRSGFGHQMLPEFCSLFLWKLNASSTLEINLCRVMKHLTLYLLSIWKIRRPVFYLFFFFFFFFFFLNELLIMK